MTRQLDTNLPKGTTTVSISSDHNFNNFDSFGLDKRILKGIYRYGWERPSPIQEKTIQAFIKNPRRDIISQAQSGTGKTGAFTISVLQNLDLNLVGTQVIILSPTRELATQTYEVCLKLGEFLLPDKNPICQLFIGGNYRRDDVNKFKKDIKIAIGTPGRMLDMVKSASLTASTVKMLILDEADDLLSQGFKEQVHEIFDLLPKQKQIGLFSATMPDDVLLLTNKFMIEPIRFLKERDELSLRGITQYKIEIPSDEMVDNTKIDILLDIYGKMEIAQAVIFCNTRKKVDIISQKLKSQDFSCAIIHSDMQRIERERVMKLFRKGENRILIATDVMARGIDVHHVSIVVNYDIPSNKENFIHRSGRAGRYGRKGITINLVSERDSDAIKEIEEYYSIQINDLPNDFEKGLN